jgi:signal peptidase S26 family
VGARPNRWPVIRVTVEEQSMMPALRPGDWLLAWRTRRIRPGQVVLAWHPQRPGFLLVKRVAWREPGGTGGARGDGGREPPMREGSPPCGGGEGDSGWWLASDNPVAGAADSARFGPVPAENIVAVVLVRYWPVRRR